MENALKITKLETQMKEVNKKLDSQGKIINGLENKLDEKFEKLMESLEEHYVRKEELVPVRAVVYGLVGTILTAVVAAVLSLINL